METIDDLLKDHELKHTEFQIKNFIVGSQFSAWARYVQCLREIKSRHALVKDLEDNLAMFYLGEKSLVKKIRMFFMNRHKKAIASRRQLRAEAAMVEDLAATEKELNHFFAIAKALKKTIGPLDEARKKDLEADAWQQQALAMAGVDILTINRIGQNTIEFILKLPKDSRSFVLKKISLDQNPDPLQLLGFYEANTEDDSAKQDSVIRMSGV